MVSTKTKTAKRAQTAKATKNDLQKPNQVNFPMELKEIPTEGTPKGTNPILVKEKARIPAFSLKMKECVSALLNLNQAETALHNAEDFYIEKYKLLGQKILEAKAVFQADNNKKLSDQAFTDEFNRLYDQKISRPIVNRARRLAEQWQHLDRTQRLCLIRGENWKDALKYDRDTTNSKKEALQDSQEQASKTKKSDYKDQAIEGMDTMDIFSKAVEKLQDEGEPLDDILDVFLSSLTSVEGKFSYKQVEASFKKVFQRMAGA